MPPSYSPCPRPILKRSFATPVVPSLPQDELLSIDVSCLAPLVRFPPHSTLAHTVGNALSYDRSPIVVSPNRCALPERGCPGRTYADDLPPSSRRPKPSGTHLHPKATRDYEARGDHFTQRSPTSDLHSLPPLVPDLSSESSEESDGFTSPPPLVYSPSIHSKISLEQSLMSLTLAGTNAPSPSALSFLPHPPSPRLRPVPSPSRPPSNTQPHPLVLSQSIPNHRTNSPVRSRSPSSPSPSSPSRSRRKSRSNPIPISSPSSPASHSPPSPLPGVPASPERERRSRHRSDDRNREHRDRSRERKERDRTERLARYKSLSDTTSRLSSFDDDSGCLGGF